jgi:Raf kinase inhibitor-like YbhB/YbcL family protein
VETPVRFQLLPLRPHGRLRKPLAGLSLGLLLILAAMAGCRSSASIAEGKPTLSLTSSSFQNGKIPKQSTCDGGDISPELAWSAPPTGARSLALTVVDLDSLFGSFTHWVLYDLPADARELPESLPKQEQLPDGSKQGRNDFDRAGYRGPCPPGKPGHRYVFTLYALDSKLDLAPGATRKQLEEAIKGHVLAHGELIGRYQH